MGREAHDSSRACPGRAHAERPEADLISASRRTPNSSATTTPSRRNWPKSSAGGSGSDARRRDSANGKDHSRLEERVRQAGGFPLASSGSRPRISLAGPCTSKTALRVFLLFDIDPWRPFRSRISDRRRRCTSVAGRRSSPKSGGRGSHCEGQRRNRKADRRGVELGAGFAARSDTTRTTSQVPSAELIEMLPVHHPMSFIRRPPPSWN